MQDQRQLVYDKLGAGNCRVVQEQYLLNLFPRQSFVATVKVKQSDRSIQGHARENAVRHVFRQPCLCHTDDEVARDRSRQDALALHKFSFTAKCATARCSNVGYLRDGIIL